MTTLPKRMPPGPQGLPFIGNIKAFDEHRLEFLMACAKEYGGIVRYEDQTYIVNDAHLIEEVLLKTNREFVIPVNFLREPITQERVLRWMHKRTHVAQAFRRSTLLNYVPATSMRINGALDALYRDVPFDVVDLMERSTSHAIADYLFGSRATRIPPLATQLLDALMSRVGSVFMIPTWVPTPAHRAIRRTFENLKAEIDALVTREEQHPVPGTAVHDLVRLELQEPEPDLDSISGLLTGTLLAGHRVPAAALAWGVALIATQPEVVARLRAEWPGGTILQGQFLSEMPYTEAVVKEVLRLYPPSWLFERDVDMDTSLGGYPLRQGQKLLFSPYVVHRQAEYFPAPEVFRPERWLEPLEPGRPRFAYFPFGGGPRICMGAAFASITIVTTLATLFSRYDVTLHSDSDLTPNPRTTLLPTRLMASLHPVQPGRVLC